MINFYPKAHVEWALQCTDPKTQGEMGCKHTLCTRMLCAAEVVSGGLEGLEFREKLVVGGQFKKV